MAGYVKPDSRETHAKSQRGTEEPKLFKWLLIGVAQLFALVFLLVPLINVFAQALGKGWSACANALSDPDTLSAVKLTLTVAAISVPLNLTFGLAAAWSIAKFRFRGKSLLVTLIDLPFSISPVVAGLIFVVLFGRQGFFGQWLDEHDLKIIFAVPGIVLATVFITFPFVARELIPVMQATGTEQEEAALTLGASGWKTFLGEFGAVSVVSGHISGQTDTMPLRVEKLYHEYNSTAAFTVASLLALLALLTLLAKSLLEWKTRRDYEKAQLAPAARPVRSETPAADFEV